MKKYFIIFTLLISMVLMVTACSNRAYQKAPVNEESKKTTKLVFGNSELKNITDFANLWHDHYYEYEQVIHNNELLSLALIMPSTCFITGAQYDLLNMGNKDGRYEGKLALAGYHGFVEKKGPILTFGYDDVLEKDGFGPLAMAGDRKFESGNCDLKNVYYYSESFSERNGKNFERLVSEFRQENDGSISCFVQKGSAFDMMGEELLHNEFVFIRNGKKRYDFVVARATVGPDFEYISLKNREDWRKEDVVVLFIDAGYKIESSGSVIDGELIFDK